jgi:exodeoxyribonuclease-3
MSLRLLTFNVQEGARGREEQVFEVLAEQEADVIVLQEVMDTTPVAEWAERLKSKSFVARGNDGRHVALLARVPFKDPGTFSPPVLRHSLLSAGVQASGGEIALFGVHLAAPAYALWVERYRLRELRAIFGHIGHAARERLILAGDFNAIAPGDRVDLSGMSWRGRVAVVLQGGLVARQVVASILERGLVDCYRVRHPNDDGFTLPSDPPRVRLDYFFASPALCDRIQSCSVVQGPRMRGLSDHLPLMLELEG